MGSRVVMPSMIASFRDLRATLRQGSLVLGLIGVIATFVSAPIDDFWHETFGRDSVP